jgi:hypothetical protein
MPIINPIWLFEGLNWLRKRGNRKKRVMLMNKKKKPSKAIIKCLFQNVFIFSGFSIFPRRVSYSDLVVY